MKQKKLLLILLVVILVLGAFLFLKRRSRNSQSGVPSQWETYQSKEYGYKVSYPPAWLLEEQHTANSRGIKIYSKEGVGFVIIRSYKSDELTSKDSIIAFIEQRKRDMDADPTITLEGFEASGQGNVGGFIAIGVEDYMEATWNFEEKGLYDIYGKAVEMHGALLTSIEKESFDVIHMIMDSFEVL